MITREKFLKTFEPMRSAIEAFIQALILVSLAALTIGTIPELPPIARHIVEWAEIITLTIFVIEYLARVFAAKNPLDYIFSLWGLVDFIAIFPSFIFSGVDLVALRALRLLRLLRVLKLARYSTAMKRLAVAFYKTRSEFVVFLYISSIIFFISASGIYYFENEAQPDKFSSIPESLWWAIATLTTVGYGDVYPVTVGGKIFTFFILMLGLGLVAVPAGLIASSLTDEKQDKEEDN